MLFVRRFVEFWIDFILGDAWEVAVGIGIALIVIALVARRWDDQGLLGLTLVATVVAVTWLALLRTTANQRRKS